LPGLRKEELELTKADADVARWWKDHAVHDYASIRTCIDHPDAGPLNFEIEILNSPLEPDQHLVVYTAQPDSPTARVLPILASWHIAPLISRHRTDESTKDLE
jgi:MmyB-like transcription regulator ligand binding domain